MGSWAGHGAKITWSDLSHGAPVHAGAQAIKLEQNNTTMKTNYAGIDYSCGLANSDAATGIHYGVISQNSIMPEALDDIMTHGEDVAYEEALNEAIKAAKTEWESEGNDPDDFDEDEAAQNFADNYQSDGGLNDYVYERDGYKLTGCLDYYIFVLVSPYYTYAQVCSPCVPGAVNLDSPFESGDYATQAETAGFPKGYCLGHDWFEGDMAPYPVYSVETGEEVTP